MRQQVESGTQAGFLPTLDGVCDRDLDAVRLSSAMVLCRRALAEQAG